MLTFCINLFHYFRNRRRVCHTKAAQSIQYNLPHQVLSKMHLGRLRGAIKKLLATDMQNSWVGKENCRVKRLVLLKNCHLLIK